MTIRIRILKGTIPIRSKSRALRCVVKEEKQDTQKCIFYNPIFVKLMVPNFSVCHLCLYMYVHRRISLTLDKGREWREKTFNCIYKEGVPTSFDPTDLIGKESWIPKLPFSTWLLSTFPYPVTCLWTPSFTR